MNTNLTDRMDELEKEYGQALDVREFQKTGMDIVHNMSIIGMMAGVDENVLKNLLLRLPQEKVFLRELPKGLNYSIIKGHALLQTLFAVLQKEGTFTPRNLERRLEEARIDVVVVRCNIDDHKAAALYKMLGVA